MIQSEFHGSDIQAVAARYGIREGEIISFSSNVNPLGLSEGFKRSMGQLIDCITEYPERDYMTLRKALEKYTGVDHQYIIPGNGSTELISAFIKCFDHCRAVIVSPAYSEYERAVKLAQGTVSYLELEEKDGFEFDTERLEDCINDDIDILVICNPVNPTSTALSAADMEKVLKKAENSNTFVLVDETYVEFCDMKSYSSEELVERYKNLFVIRSMSKFFSCPGLRLGYALTKNTDLIERINSHRDPWSVSSFAEKSAILLLSDIDHIRGSKEYIEGERKRVCGLLDELSVFGLKYYSPRANFVLCRLEQNGKNATGLFEYCLGRKLMIRDCTGYGNLDGRYFRFCFMDKDSNNRLLETIRDYLSE